MKISRIHSLLGLILLIELLCSSLMSFPRLYGQSGLGESQWRASGPNGDSVRAVMLDSSGTLYTWSATAIYHLLAGQGAHTETRLPAGKKFDDVTAVFTVDTGLYIVSGCCDLYYTADRGSNWKLVSTLTNPDGERVLFESVGPLLYMASTAPGRPLQVSSDGGTSWTTPSLSGTTSATGLRQLMTNGTSLYGIDGRGLIRLEGKDWRVVGPDASSIAGGIEGAIFQGDTIVLRTTSKSSQLYRSVDGGVRWNEMEARSPIDMLVQDGLLYGLFQDGLYTLGLAEDEWKSAIPFVRANVERTGIIAIDSVLVMYDPFGLHRLTAGSSTLTDYGYRMNKRSILNIKMVIDTASYRPRDSMVVNARDALYLRAQNGNWIRREVPSEVSLDNLTVIGMSIYTFDSLSATIHRSRDRGLSWTRFSPTSPHGKIYSVWSEDDVMIAGGDRQIARTSDGGKSWTTIYFQSNGILKTIVGDDNRIFILTDNNHLYRSFDYGEHWQEVTPPVDYNGDHQLLYANEQIYFGSSRSGLFISKTFGSDWEEAHIDVFLPSIWRHKTIVGVNRMAIARDGNIVLCGPTDLDSIFSEQAVFEGIFRDGRIEWGSNRIISTPVNDVCLETYMFYVATPKNGVWEIPLFDNVTSPDLRNQNRSAISLTYRPYASLLEWNVPIASLHSRFSLRLYTIQGEEVFSSHDILPTGNQCELRLPTDRLPSGIYHALLTENDQSVGNLQIQVVR